MRRKNKVLTLIFKIGVIVAYITCIIVLVTQGLTPGGESANISNNVGNQLNDFISTIHKTEAQIVNVSEVKITDYTISDVKYDYNYNITLTHKDEGKFNCTVLPEKATNKSITYSSSDSSIVEIEANGRFTAKNIGTCEIKAISTENNNIFSSIIITVTPIETEKIIIDNKISELRLTQTHYCLATIIPSNATYNQLTWHSSNTDVATINKDGEIIAIAEGATTITATLEGNPEIFDSFELTVIKLEDLTIFAEQVTISFANISDENKSYFMAKDKIQLLADIIPSNTTNKSIAWKSSSTSIATVSTKGLVTFKKGGSVKITATSSDGKASCSKSFTVYDILPSKITISSPSLSIETDDEGNYVAYIAEKCTAKLSTKLSSDSTTTSVKFSSSNTNVATISSKGDITALRQGVTKIKIYCSTKIDEVAIYLILNVTKAENYILAEGIRATTYELNNDSTKSIVNNTIDVYVGDTIEITPTIYPQNATAQTYKISSSNIKIVSIDSNGLLTAISPGTATITYSVDEIRSSDDPPLPKQIIKIIVNKIGVTGIEITSPPTEIVEGETIGISTTISPANATNTNLIWQSSNTDVITVNNGVLTALSEGTTTITITSEDNSDVTFSFTIYVKPKTILLESISLTAEKATIYRGETLTLLATCTPDNATFTGLIWHSSDNSIVKINDSGVVTTGKAGIATITVKSNTYDDIFATFNVTVKEIVSKTISLKLSGLTKNDDNTLSLKEAESAKIKATLEKTATVKTINFSSSNPEVAKIDADGVIEAITNGITVITISTTDGEITTEVTFTLKVNAVTFKDTMENFYLWVRKSIGHFGAFLVLGIFAALSFIMLTPNKIASKIIAFILCSTSGFAVAGITEICQLPVFTAGRHCAFSDVLLDFSGYICSCGAIFAIAIICAIIATINYFIKKHKDIPSNQIENVPESNYIKTTEQKLNKMN